MFKLRDKLQKPCSTQQHVPACFVKSGNMQSVQILLQLVGQFLLRAWGRLLEARLA